MGARLSWKLLRGSGAAMEFDSEGLQCGGILMPLRFQQIRAFAAPGKPGCRVACPIRK